MSAENAIRHWEKEFKTSIQLVTGDLFSGAARPQAELSLTNASPDTDIEWHVKLNLALKQPADSGWRLDVEVCPYTTATPKTLVALTAKGKLSRMGSSSPQCWSCQRNVTPGSYCCGRLVASNSNSQVGTDLLECQLAEACTFKMTKDITKNLLTTATVNGISVSVLHLLLEMTHYKEKKMRLPKQGSLPSLGPNLKELLESGRMSDVTFRVGGEDVKAHSQVLGAASAVFAAMFTLDTKDRRTGRVDVPDASAACFREMLRCIYLASAPAWDGARTAEEAEELLLGLLFLSEKYALAALGKHCQGRLLSTLTLANVVERLKVVDVVCPALVPAITFPFVRSQLAEVLAQEAWAALMRDDLKLAAKVMHSAMLG